MASGRLLEPLARYSRALRVGDLVLQSGTTAIDLRNRVTSGAPSSAGWRLPWKKM